MKSRNKNIYFTSFHFCYLPVATQYFWWELDKEEEPQLLRVEAAASVWDLEPCGAVRSLRRALGSANSDSGWTQVGYCNISHTQTYTSKCTHTHTHKRTHISAWVIPKAFTTTSLTGKKRMRKAEQKKLQNTQKASECTAQSCLSDAAWGAGFLIHTVHFEFRSISKHQRSLRIHLRPWGREKIHAIFENVIYLTA